MVDEDVDDNVEPPGVFGAEDEIVEEDGVAEDAAPAVILGWSTGT